MSNVAASIQPSIPGGANESKTPKSGEESAKNAPAVPRPLTVIFCLPGASFSGRFLDCWSELLAWCMNHGIRAIISRRQSCNIYYVRNMCLGADMRRGKDQKPFNGQVEYDYLLWIDSDVIFSPEHFQRLLDHKVDIVSGLYLMEGAKEFATVKDWDEGFFIANGRFQFLTLQDLAFCRNLIDVAYTGMGFMLVRRGVFEAMEYPWFKPLEKRIGHMVDFTMEDVAFCLRAREKGFKIFVDPAVRVGHEKGVVL